jgi:hypothetical protein
MLPPNHFSGLTPDADVELFWTTDDNFNVSIDLRIVVTPETNMIVYWAHEFRFGDGGAGYLALGIGGSTKLAMMSVWGATQAETSGSDPGRESCFQTVSPLDQPGWGCVLEFDWKLNQTYGLRIRALNKAPSGEEWWQATVSDYSTNAEKVIGKTLTPSTFGWLTQSTVTWVEYSLASSCDVPRTRAVFSNSQAHGPNGNRAPERARVRYPSACLNSNVQYVDNGAYVTEAGQNVVRTTWNETWLWTVEPHIIEHPIPEFPFEAMFTASVLAMAVFSVSFSRRKRKTH